MKSPVIGIDLGTTYSCVAVFQHGKVEIIANDQGNRTTPSCVAFTDSQRFIGEAAKSQATRNPENTVFEMKRLMGRTCDDPNVQEDTQNWPVKIVDNDGRPNVQVQYKGKRRLFTAQELSAMVLTKMKATAEAYLGTTVKDAVITVPAYFNDLQRQATKDAATIAGLNTKRIINEPTAAALAYSLDKRLAADHNVLVFDLGGGTFDVSILTITDGTLLEVKSTAGDTHLGGGDFDNRLVHHFVDEFRRKYHLDVRNSPRAMRQLRAACEQAKIALSSCTETAVEIDFLYQEIYFYSRISRARFEELCIDLFRQTLKMVDKALDDACLTKSDIHEVVLAGGSTRIPRIQKLLEDYFAGRTLNRSVHPDEAVAYGAAVQAAALSGDSSDLIKEILLVDVVPLSLGTDVSFQDRMETLIGRNTRIPATARASFFPAEDYQTTVHIGVYQGERKFVKDNEMLGELYVAGLPCAPKKQVCVLVEFNVDTDGILNVRAKGQRTDKWETLTIDNSKSRLHPVEIKRMLREAEEAVAEDDARCETLEAIQKLEHYVFSARRRAAEAGETLTNAENHTIRQRCGETIDRLEMGTLTGKEEVNEQLRTLQRQLDPILATCPPHQPDTEAPSPPRTRRRSATDTTGYRDEDEDATRPQKDTLKGAREEDASRSQSVIPDHWATSRERPSQCSSNGRCPSEVTSREWCDYSKQYGCKQFTSVMDEVD